MDAEILTLLIESLKAVGLSHFKISLGHVGFYQALLAQSGLSEQGRSKRNSPRRIKTCRAGTNPESRTRLTQTGPADP